LGGKGLTKFIHAENLFTASENTRVSMLFHHILQLRYNRDCMIDGNFGNLSADVLISQVAHQGKWW